MREMPRRIWRGLPNNIKSKLTSLHRLSNMSNKSGSASAINELPLYLDDVLRNIERYTGMSGTIMVGGPVPGENGAISATR
jgi:hypothetical protein